MLAYQYFEAAKEAVRRRCFDSPVVLITAWREGQESVVTLDFDSDIAEQQAFAEQYSVVKILGN
jgi:hypothetical protein